jgi:hypothetical protein
MSHTTDYKILIALTAISCVLLFIALIYALKHVFSQPVKPQAKVISIDPYFDEYADLSTKVQIANDQYKRINAISEILRFREKWENKSEKYARKVESDYNLLMHMLNIHYEHLELQVNS